MMVFQQDNTDNTDGWEQLGLSRKKKLKLFPISNRENNLYVAFFTSGMKKLNTTTYFFYNVILMFETRFYA